MKSSFARYRSVGHKLVTGFMEPEVLLVAGALDEAQRARSVGGAVAALEREVSDMKEQFATRKLVERAKSLLQSKMGLSEPEAFRWIQKTAMDLRKPMREVAEGVIEQAKRNEGKGLPKR